MQRAATSLSRQSLLCCVCTHPLPCICAAAPQALFLATSLMLGHQLLVSCYALLTNVSYVFVASAAHLFSAPAGLFLATSLTLGRRDNLHKVLLWVHSHRVAGFAIFCLLYVWFTVLFLPPALLAACAGAIYGLGPAIPLVSNAAQHSAAQSSTGQHRAALRSRAAQHSTVQSSSAQFSAAQHSSAQFSVVRVCALAAVFGLCSVVGVDMSMLSKSQHTGCLSCCSCLCPKPPCQCLAHCLLCLPALPVACPNIQVP